MSHQRGRWIRPRKGWPVSSAGSQSHLLARSHPIISSKSVSCAARFRSSDEHVRSAIHGIDGAHERAASGERSAPRSKAEPCDGTAPERARVHRAIAPARQSSRADRHASSMWKRSQHEPICTSSWSTAMSSWHSSRLDDEGDARQQATRRPRSPRRARTPSRHAEKAVARPARIR